MAQFPDHTTIKDLDGTEVVVHSNKQREKFMKRVENKTNSFVHIKVVKQYYDGNIMLHLFFMDDAGQLKGYAESIGKRGGIKTSYGHSAYKDGAGAFWLKG